MMDNSSDYYIGLIYINWLAQFLNFNLIKNL